MLKKTIFASMVSALMFSSIGSVFAMEEDHGIQISQKQISEKSPSSKADEGEFIDPLLAQITSSLRVGKYVQTQWKEAVDSEIKEVGKEAIRKHLAYGFTKDFIRRNFAPTSCLMMAEHRLKLDFYSHNCKPDSHPHPFEILKPELEDLLNESSIIARSFQINLTKLYEKNEMKYKNQNCSKYDTYFGAFYHFIERMDEEQQKTTISLLLPHLNLKNFANFYPFEFINGMDNDNVSNLDGDTKIRWLRRTLKNRGYYPPSL